MAGAAGHAERDKHADGLRAFGCQIRERGRRRAPADLLEREPVRPEMDALDRTVDAERQRRPAQRDQRAVVAKLAGPGPQASEDLRSRSNSPFAFALID